MHQFDLIKEFLPNGFHQTDLQGRPIWYLSLGDVKVANLFDSCTAENLQQYFLVQLERCIKFKLQKADQIVLIVDLKGAKLKDMTNKSLTLVFKNIISLSVNYYSELLNRCFFLNTPIFFESIWEQEFKKMIPSWQNFIFTGESHHPEFNIANSDLPQAYGGDCQCQASCIYSEKGPWSDKQNTINYRDRETGEEFKFNDTDLPINYESNSDDEESLNRKPLVDRNDTEIRDLKSALQLGNFMVMQSDSSKSQKLITMIGDQDEACIGISSDENEMGSGFDKDLLKKMLLGNGLTMKEMPGMTPMNTQMDDNL